MNSSRLRRAGSVSVPRAVCRAALCGLLALCAAPRLCQAQTAVSWANVGSTFSTGANWVGGAAPADNTTSSIATFGTVTVQPELTADRSVARLSFLGTTAATLSGSSTLTLGNATSLTNSSTTGMKTIAVPLKLPTLSTITNAGELTLSGAIAGTNPTSCRLTFEDTSTGPGSVISGDLAVSSLTKTGSGVLMLTGSMSGLEVTVSAGTLAMGAANSLSDTAGVVIDAGAALDLRGFSDTIGALTGTGAVILGSGTLAVGAANVTDFDESSFYGSISGSGGLTKVGTGDFQLFGTNTYAGTTTIAGGTLTLRSGSALPTTSPVVFSAGATLYKPFFTKAVTVGSLSGTGAVTLESGTLTIGTSGSSTAFAGKITGGRLVKDGAGTQTITGTISGGSIHALGGSLVLGATGDRAVVSGNILVTDSLYATGSTVINSTSINNTGYLELNDSAVISAAVITGVGNLYTFGSASLGASTITNGNGLSLWGQSTAGSASITNNQTMIFNGTSTAGSASITNNASLQLRDASSAAGATVTNASTGVIDVQYSNAASIGALSGGGSLTLGNRTVTIGARGTNTTFSGTISGAGGSLVKTGSGTLTLSAANTYSGATTIAGGRLAVSGAGSIGTGVLSLGTEGLFDLAAFTSGTYFLPATGDLVGSGTLVGSGKTLAVLGSFRPGNSPGTVTVGTGFTLDLASSGTSVFEITSPDYTAGSYDLVTGGGNVVLGGVLSLVFTNGPYANGTDVLRLFANTGILSGSFSSVQVSGLGAEQSVMFNSATGYLTLVPEPAGVASAAFAAVALLRAANRRRPRG